MEQQAMDFLAAVNQYIRPASFPVAVKLIPTGMELPRPERMRTPLEMVGHPLALCQGVAMARQYGRTSAFDQESHACPVGAVIMGHYDKGPLEAGVATCPGYVADREAAYRMEQGIAKLPLHSVKEVWLAPMERAPFDPDLAIVYGTPAQMARMIHGANYETGEGVASNSFGRGACGSYIAQCYLSQKCTLVVPSGGERIFALTQDHEMMMAVPAVKMASMARGLAATHKAGLVRYPTPFYALQAEPKFPDYYQQLLPEEARKNAKKA